MNKGSPKWPTGYTPLLTGEGSFDVVIREKVQREIGKKARDEQKAGLESLVKSYVENGPKGLPRSKFAGDEGWFPSARNKRIRLEAFKPWQLRAYGFCRNYRGRPTFFITGVDISKKQNDAAPEILKAAGAEAVRLNDELGD